jgi:hypothetical protein
MEFASAEGWPPLVQTGSGPEVTATYNRWLPFKCNHSLSSLCTHFEAAASGEARRTKCLDLINAERMERQSPGEAPKSVASRNTRSA